MSKIIEKVKKKIEDRKKQKKLLEEQERYAKLTKVEKEKEFRKKLEDERAKNPNSPLYKFKMDPNRAVNPSKEHQTTFKKSFTGQAKKDKEAYLKWMVEKGKKKKKKVNEY